MKLGLSATNPGDRDCLSAGAASTSTQRNKRIYDVPAIHRSSLGATVQSLAHDLNITHSISSRATPSRRIGRRIVKRIVAIIIIIVASVFAAVPAFAQKQFKVSERVKLGGEGGWDYLTFDQDGLRLFITRGSHVMVIDTRTLKVAGDIPDLSGIHGVALAPELNRGFVSN